MNSLTVWDYSIYSWTGNSSFLQSLFSLFPCFVLGGTLKEKKQDCYLDTLCNCCSVLIVSFSKSFVMCNVRKCSIVILGRQPCVIGFSCVGCVLVCDIAENTNNVFLAFPEIVEIVQPTVVLKKYLV